MQLDSQACHSPNTQAHARIPFVKSIWILHVNVYVSTSNGNYIPFVLAPPTTDCQHTCTLTIHSNNICNISIPYWVYKQKKTCICLLTCSPTCNNIARFQRNKLLLILVSIHNVGHLSSYHNSAVIYSTYIIGIIVYIRTLTVFNDRIVYALSICVTQNY